MSCADSTWKCNGILLVFAPIRGEMFIERATAKKFSGLQRSETKSFHWTSAGNIALRWSA